MKKISINNGNTFVTPEEAIHEMDWDTIVSHMDDHTREKTHGEMAPCSDVEFLKKYLENATDDLIIG